ASPGSRPRSLVRDPRPPRRGARQIAGARRSRADQRGRHDRPLCRRGAAHPPPDSGMGPLASEPDDVALSARDRPSDRERYMRAYLAWEVELVNKIAPDTDCRFRLAPV